MTFLRGRVAIVTGGAKGVGEAVARAFAASGASVVIADLDAEAGEQVARSIRASGGTAVFVEADVADESGAAHVVAIGQRDFGGVDVLINNAAAVGLQRYDGPLLETSFETFRSTLEINVGGYFLMSRAALPSMLERGGGSIVNVSSITALRGELRLTAYGASKAAIAQLTRAVSTQYSGRGVRCNAIAPSYVSTEGNEKRVPAALQRAYLRQTPAGLLVSPQDVAGLAVFLAGDEARLITGQLIPVDGGLTSASPVVADFRDATTPE